MSCDSDEIECKLNARTSKLGRTNMYPAASSPSVRPIGSFDQNWRSNARLLSAAFIRISGGFSATACCRSSAGAVSPLPLASQPASVWLLLGAQNARRLIRFASGLRIDAEFLDCIQAIKRNQTISQTFSEEQRKMEVKNGK